MQQNDLSAPPKGAIDVDMTAMYLIQHGTGVIGISKGGVHPCICPFAAIEYRQDTSPSSNLITANEVAQNAQKYADKPYRLQCSSLCPHFELLNLPQKPVDENQGNEIPAITHQLTVRLSCGGVPRQYIISPSATK